MAADGGAGLEFGAEPLDGAGLAIILGTARFENQEWNNKIIIGDISGSIHSLSLIVRISVKIALIADLVCSLLFDPCIFPNIANFNDLNESNKLHYFSFV